MVDLKISLRSEELQYLKEGLWMQLVLIVVSKSGGSFKLLRSSTTDAECIVRDKVNIMDKNRRVSEMEAMNVVLLECVCGFVKVSDSYST